MRKRNLYIITIITLCLLLICSCAPVRKALDARSGLSKNLTATENHIRKADWDNAATSLISTEKSWHKIKPILQLDIDHNYVNDIENNIVKLKAYLESQEKADSLSIILLIQKSWEDIGQM
ncbi:MAG: DUF4363 family protein [Clostridia bacterium]